MNKPLSSFSDSAEPACPSDTGCYSLLQRAGCPGQVIDHARAVRAVADLFTGDEAVSRCIVESGALLHDIGRSESHFLDHAVRGGDLCREQGVAKEVARVVACHLGAGLSADECLQLGLLPRDCMPHTLPEKIVAHADNLVKGTTVIHIEGQMMKNLLISRKKRKRMFRLSLEMELFLK